MGASRAKAAFTGFDHYCMRRALDLAQQAFGATSPNPMVGAVIARHGRIVAEGFHRQAGFPHAEINALADAARRGADPRGATLYVTLEPCSTHGRTPPCTTAIIQAGISEVVVAAIDPNPKHAGAGLKLLRKTGINVRAGLLASESERLNETFNFWISHGTPFVTLKCAMSLDGKIATSSGESKWITGARARAAGMRLRLNSDAILTGVNTIIRDDPSLTLRTAPGVKIPPWKQLRRIILDPSCRIPLDRKVLTDDRAPLTIVVVSEAAADRRVKTLRKQVEVIAAPVGPSGDLNLHWLARKLGGRNITSLLVEGGGETHARFLNQALGNRIVFFHAPIVIGGRQAPRTIGGDKSLPGNFKITGLETSQLGRDLCITACLNHTAD